jgi:hypothetical protein
MPFRAISTRAGGETAHTMTEWIATCGSIGYGMGVGMVVTMVLVRTK